MMRRIKTIRLNLMSDTSKLMAAASRSVSRRSMLMTSGLPLTMAAPAATPETNGCPLRLTLRAARATPAAEMLQGMGLNTHFSFLDTAYHTRYAEVRQRLMALGLRRVRDAPNARIADLARDGISTLLLCEPAFGTPAGIVGRVAALNVATPGAVDGLEGPNEPDIYWPRLGHRHLGQGWPEGVASFVADLRAALQSNPRTRELPLIGPALGLAGTAGSPHVPALDTLWRHVDLGNAHPYPYNGNPHAPAGSPYGTLSSPWRHGTQPSVNIAEQDQALEVPRRLYPGLPLAATETGYPAGSHFTDEALHACYVPRLYAEYHRLGFKRTYLYQLLDWHVDTTGRDPEGAFGLLRADLSERPAFATLARLCTLLHGAGASGANSSALLAAELDLEVLGAPDFPDVAKRVHHLLLRGDGRLLLLIWHEVSGEDASTASPRRRIDVSLLPGRLRLDRPMAYVVETLAPSAEPPRSGHEREIDFAVGEAVVAVVLTPR